MIIDEKKFNRLWTISKYVLGLYQIITNIILFFMFHQKIISNNFILALYIMQTLLGIIILTYAPRLGAYMMAGLLTIPLLITISGLIRGSSILASQSIIFDPANLIIIFAYIMFGLLTELKETARQ